MCVCGVERAWCGARARARVCVCVWCGVVCVSVCVGWCVWTFAAIFIKSTNTWHHVTQIPRGKHNTLHYYTGGVAVSVAINIPKLSGPSVLTPTLTHTIWVEWNS